LIIEEIIESTSLSENHLATKDKKKGKEKRGGSNRN